MTIRSMLLAAALAFSGSAFASTWDSDPTHTVAAFSAKHLVVTTVRGEFGTTTATLELDDKDITKSKVEATIDTTTIDTRTTKRDDHLKSPDFFDVAKFPKMTFKSTKVEKGAGDNKLKVTGDLTIRDVTKPVTLDVDITGEAQNPFSKAAVRGFAATGSINRTDWGLKWNMPLANNGLLVSEEVKLFIDVEFIKREAKPAAAPAKK